MNAASKPDNPRGWLARARSNLLLAESGQQRGVFLEDLCFEAQQAAEKALKAVCVFYKIEFPKTHSLITLTALLEQAGIQLPPDVQEADPQLDMLQNPRTISTLTYPNLGCIM
jgi:HEPN domain-containing protein